MTLNPWQFLIQAGFMSGVIAVLFLLFSFTDRSFNLRVRWLFRAAAMILVVLVASDAANVFAGMREAPAAMSYISDTMGYILRPGVVMILCFILGRRKRIIYAVTHLIFTLNAILMISNAFFPGIVFTYTAENVFVRGPLGWAPFVASGFYLLLFLIWAVEKYIRLGSLEIVVAAFILVATVSALILEVVYKYEFMVVGVIGLGTVFYYLYLHIQVYSRDALTSVYNRRNFFLDVEKERHNTFVVVALDVNNLKDINDRCGHSEGDRALCSVVDAMRHSLRRGCTMYRMGGDEFEVICRRMTVPEVERMMRSFNTHLSKTPFGAAYGISTYSPGMDVESVVEAADKDMYLRKFTMKKV